MYLLVIFSVDKFLVFYWSLEFLSLCPQLLLASFSAVQNFKILVYLLYKFIFISNNVTHSQIWEAVTWKVDNFSKLHDKLTNCISFNLKTCRLRIFLTILSMSQFNHPKWLGKKCSNWLIFNWMQLEIKKKMQLENKEFSNFSVFPNIIMAKWLKQCLLSAASEHLAVHILVCVSLVSSFMWSNCGLRFCQTVQSA